MKNILLLIVIFMTNSAAYSASSEYLCAEVQKYYADAAPQSPLRKQVEIDLSFCDDVKPEDMTINQSCLGKTRKFESSIFFLGELDYNTLLLMTCTLATVLVSEALGDLIYEQLY